MGTKSTKSVIFLLFSLFFMIFRYKSGPYLQQVPGTKHFKKSEYPPLDCILSLCMIYRADVYPRKLREAKSITVMSLDYFEHISSVACFLHCFRTPWSVHKTKTPCFMHTSCTACVMQCVRNAYCVQGIVHVTHCACNASSWCACTQHVIATRVHAMRVHPPSFEGPDPSLALTMID